MGRDRDEDWLERVRDRLLAWFEVEKRDLPWRADRNPYRILVSEMMLVQTTVAAVVPYFQRFVAVFPDFEALAAAEEERVLKAWEGLGYYRRARQLHAAAKKVVQEHGGRMPEDPSSVRELPGVGRYIAGAVLSQAFDLPEPIVEANSRRVLARLLALVDDIATAPVQERLWEAAARLVPPKHAGEFNQALMELGALICSPRAPRCLICPVSRECEAYRLGVQEQIPRTAPRTAPSAVAEACAIVSDKGRVLVLKRGSPGLWAGFWEFPTIHLEGPDPAGRTFEYPVDLKEGVKRLTGATIVVGEFVESLTYGVTRYRVRLDAFAARLEDGARLEKLRTGPAHSELTWESISRIRDMTFSSSSRRLIASILANPGKWGITAS